MKKTFVAIALIVTSAAIVSSEAVSAQSRSGRGNSERNYRDVRPFEFEIGTGANMWLSGLNWGEYDYDNSMAGVSLYFEPRFNIPRSPISVAMQLSIGASGNIYDDHDFAQGYYNRDRRVSFLPSVVTFVDYNWRDWRHVSMFAGLGVGMARSENVYDEGYTYDHTDYDYHGWEFYSDRTLVLNPRFGVEFWNRLRLTAEYKFMKEDYSYFGMTVGVSIGGDRKGRGR